MSELNNREQRVLELNARHLTQREIAQEIGDLSPRQVRNVIERLRDLGYDIQVNKQSRAKIDAAEIMFKQGKTNQEIADALGVASSKVSHWKSSAKLRGLPVPSPQKAPPKTYNCLIGLAMDPADLKYGGRRFDDR